MKISLTGRFKKINSSSGFTLVEALVAISIFLVVVAMTTSIFTDSFASKRKTELSRNLYEEARITLERVVKEVRRGTIDYEEYWNRYQYQDDVITDDAYGQNYGDYARQFYRDSGSQIPATITRYDENIGENTGSDPLGDASTLSVCQNPQVPTTAGNSSYEQCELYLITAEGGEKTIIKLKEDGLVAGEYRLEMLKLPGRDSDADGQVDDWEIRNGANPSPSKFFDFCSAYDVGGVCTTPQFQKIQPDSIKITSLKFYISPREDPRKAFAEFTDDVQQHPHVMIELTAEPSESYVRGIRGDPPTVTLQTTIGARAQNEVKSANY